MTEKYSVDKKALQMLVGEFKIMIESLEHFINNVIGKYKNYINEWVETLYGDRVGDTLS